MKNFEDRRWPALYVLCAGVLMIILDTTIVNVALPSIQDDLGFSQGDLAWVVNAYLIAFGGLLMLAGRAGDLVGRRRIFLIGLAVLVHDAVAVARRDRDEAGPDPVAQRAVQRPAGGRRGLRVEKRDPGSLHVRQVNRTPTDEFSPSARSYRQHPTTGDQQ